MIIVITADKVTEPTPTDATAFPDNFFPEMLIRIKLRRGIKGISQINVVISYCFLLLPGLSDSFFRASASTVLK